MNDQTDSQLLGAWAETRSEPAFAELVRRHVDFVHSAAVRMVCDSHLAKDVTQSVFVALAKDAARITDCRVLAGWLHRTAQNIAAQTVRTDVRRRARELEAATMNELLATEPDLSRRSETAADAWAHIAPQLDAALGELSEPDRDAVLLRYFENKSLREVGQALGTSDDTAQKRVSRAVERLREFFAKRGVTVGASGLVVVISANAVQAAPVGLAVTISTAATLAGTTIAATATATAIKTIAMTTLQKTLITATLAVVAGVGIYEARQAAKLREQNQTLQQQRASLADQIQQLQRERDDATNRLTSLADQNATLQRNPTEVLKLRGQVGTLRNQLQSATNAARKSPGAGETANVFNTPAMRQARSRASQIGNQKQYAPLIQQMKLTPEQAGKFVNLLGDNSQRIQDQTIAALREETSQDAASQAIKNLKNELEGELQTLLGPERYAQYQEFKLNQSPQHTLDSFTKVLPDNSLGADQRQRLFQLLRDNQLGALEPTSPEEIERYFQRQAEIDRNILQQAGSFLASEQLAALASLQIRRISEQREASAVMLRLMGVSGQGRTATDNRGK